MKHKHNESADDVPRKFRQIMDRMQNAPTQKKQKKPAEPRMKRNVGESMYQFSRRVDEAIPLPRSKGINTKATQRNAKKHKTKSENLRQEYKQRLEAKNRKLEEMEDPNDISVASDDEDIWAQVNAKKEKPKFGEVADRPPELFKPKKNTIPKSAGSLARRKMLEEERERFIREYRKLKGDDAI